MLTFQRLDVYQRAIELLAVVGEIIEDLLRGPAERADQLIRAAESIVRNIAEGRGAGLAKTVPSTIRSRAARPWNAPHPSTSCASES
jgi:hypothetical protein